jgi:ectoine hydroxylase
MANTKRKLRKRPLQELNADFWRDGFVLIQDFFSPEEVNRLRANSESGGLTPPPGKIFTSNASAPQIKRPGRNRTDESDTTDPSCKLRGIVEVLLGDDVCHVQSKVLDDTEAKVGGSWPWHQDYWYAYQCGFLFPDMATGLIALYRTTAENGALQVVRGSHKMGRLDHVLLDANGGRRQSTAKSGVGPVWIGADPSRVELATSRLQIVDCVMNPGDVLVFHANCLHRSGDCSKHSGRALLCSCYSAAQNLAVQSN